MYEGFDKQFNIACNIVFNSRFSTYGNRIKIKTLQSTVIPNPDLSTIAIGMSGLGTVSDRSISLKSLSCAQNTDTDSYRGQHDGCFFSFYL